MRLPDGSGMNREVHVPFCESLEGKFHRSTHPYYRLKGVKHALCHAHHLREIKALIEYDKEPWATKMWKFLKFTHTYRQFEEKIPRKNIKYLEKAYEQVLEEGFVYHEKLPSYDGRKRGKGRVAHRAGYNLLHRLRKRQEDALRFLKEPTVPFTNNQAERDLRMMKLKQKISGGFRTERGAKVFIHIRGFISTLRKQERDIFLALFDATQGVIPKFSPS